MRELPAPEVIPLVDWQAGIKPPLPPPNQLTWICLPTQGFMQSLLTAVMPQWGSPWAKSPLFGHTFIPTIFPHRGSSGLLWVQSKPKPLQYKDGAVCWSIAAQTTGFFDTKDPWSLTRPKRQRPVQPISSSLAPHFLAPCSPTQKPTSGSWPKSWRPCLMCVPKHQASHESRGMSTLCLPSSC